MASQRDLAVIGLGAIGLPMARRLGQTLRTAAFDVNSDRTELARSAGLQVTASPAEAAAGARVLLLAVRTAEQAFEALFGAAGAAGAMDTDAVVLLTSTVGSEAARTLADRLGRRGRTLVDAPVSGGSARAARGELLVFLGGADDAIARARPVLAELAATTVTVGPEAGDGQSMKIVNQLLCGIHVAAAAEALTLADSLGLDLDRTLAAMLAGAASSFMLENRGPRILEVLRGIEPEVRSRIDIFVKDMGLVTDAARAGGVPAPLASTAEQLYRLASVAGMAPDDDSVLARLYRSCLK